MAAVCSVVTLIGVFNMESWTATRIRKLEAAHKPLHDSLWKYSAKDIDGNEMSLSQFDGSVGFVVNTATH